MEEKLRVGDMSLEGFEPRTMPFANPARVNNRMPPTKQFGPAQNGYGSQWFPATYAMPIDHSSPGAYWPENMYDDRRKWTHENRTQQYGPANQMTPSMRAVIGATGFQAPLNPNDMHWYSPNDRLPQNSQDKGPSPLRAIWDKISQYAGQHMGQGGGGGGQSSAPAVPEGGTSFMGIPREQTPYQHPSAGYNEMSAMFAGNHLRDFANAPQNLVNTVNQGNAMLGANMGNYNDRVAHQNDQRLALEAIRSRERMFQDMSRALLGGGGMNGMGQGVRDTNSGLQVGNGQVSTNINAQPLRLADILGADNAVRNTAVQHNSPVRPVSPEQQAELNQLMAGRLREIAPNVERGLIDENTPFKLAIQQGRGQQFQGLAGLLNGMRGDEISRQGQNIRTLMGMAS